MSRRREEREFALALALSTQVPIPLPSSLVHHDTSVYLSSPAKFGTSANQPQSSTTTGHDRVVPDKMSHDDVVADSEDEGGTEDGGLFEMGGSEGIAGLTTAVAGPSDASTPTAARQSSPVKPVHSSTSITPTRDTISSFSPNPSANNPPRSAEHVPNPTTDSIKTFPDSAASPRKNAKDAQLDTTAPTERVHKPSDVKSTTTARPRPRPKASRTLDSPHAGPSLQHGYTTHSTPGTSQLEPTLPNTGNQQALENTASRTIIPEDEIDPSLIFASAAAATSGKVTTYSRKDRRSASGDRGTASGKHDNDDNEEAEEDQGKDCGSTSTKEAVHSSRRVEVSVVIEGSRIRQRKPPVRFGAQESKKQVRQLDRAIPPEKPHMDREVESPDPLDESDQLDRVDRSRLPSEMVLAEVTVKNKRRKVVDTDDDDFEVTARRKDRVKAKKNPAARGKAKVSKAKVISDDDDEVMPECPVEGDSEGSRVTKQRSSDLLIVVTGLDEDDSDFEVVPATKGNKSAKKTEIVNSPRRADKHRPSTSLSKSRPIIEDSDNDETEKASTDLGLNLIDTSKTSQGNKTATQRARAEDDEEAEIQDETSDVDRGAQNTSTESPTAKAEIAAHTPEAPAKATTAVTSAAPLRAVAVNVASPASKLQSPRVVIDKNGNVKEFKTARDDLPQVVAKSGGVKRMGFSRSTRIPSLHRKIKTPPKKLPPVPQKPQKRKKGEDSDEDSDGIDEHGNKKIRRGDPEWYMQADDGF